MVSCKEIQGGSIYYDVAHNIADRKFLIWQHGAVQISLPCYINKW